MKKKWVMINLFLKKNGFKRAEYLKKHHIFAQLGENCYYHPFNIPAESNLVKLGSNVIIATGVQFITHDMTYTLFNNHPVFKYSRECFPYYTGIIEIEDNVMIGANSLIMPNIKIEKNVIVAAGSVVTKDIPEGVVVGGNPAKIIGDFFEVADKRIKYSKGDF